MRVTDTTYTTDLQANRLITGDISAGNELYLRTKLDSGVHTIAKLDGYGILPGVSGTTRTLGNSNNYWTAAYLSDIYLSNAINFQNGNSTSHLVTISAAGNTATADHTWYIPNLNSNRYFVTHNADTALGSVSQPVYISNHAAASLCTATLDLVYPVGSIYISTVADNPNPDKRANALFPNTIWVAFGKGRMLVGYDDTQGSTFGTGGAEGGSTTKSLIDLNLPSHQHLISSDKVFINSTGSHQHKGYYDLVQTTNGNSGRLTGQQSGSSNTSNNITQAAGAHTHTVSGVTDFTPAQGSGAVPFDVMNPYVVVYMWKRTE